MYNWFSNIADTLSVWTTVRAAGLTSYMLLFAAIFAGLLQGETWAKGARKVQLNLIHQWAGWFGMLFGLVHGLVLLFDKYIGYSFFEIVIPFASKHEPFWTGLGTIAFYLMFALILSSDMMKSIGKRTWRIIHFMALPTFILALLHAAMIGTDSGTAAMKLMYSATGVLVVVMLIRRIYLATRKPAGRRPAHPEVIVPISRPDKKISSFR
ncbi:ferric reductase-like transmembrane domain-containing protein [Paenibacillus sp. HN-1]|uniref:ferric reductase-like transmembrane domain-containing protein n=1 Tax=Paenibacillus TaxID=44249 RepID=UPI001CA93065|nr:MULTISPECIES: ferric reductase-like transmembrane domain-containing protein [Paenibacillus]MBY9078057.1 ferric reductase-like transmembrane domain-containing protein [Paenibacillus sp. CGMCC 1.18879]MBY9083798.1 ferric reductase-like transmembrane domain-containing protein [Paenibacillus sinensis]